MLGPAERHSAILHLSSQFHAWHTQVYRDVDTHMPGTHDQHRPVTSYVPTAQQNNLAERPLIATLVICMWLCLQAPVTLWTQTLCFACGQRTRYETVLILAEGDGGLGIRIHVCMCVSSIKQS